MRLGATIFTALLLGGGLAGTASASTVRVNDDGIAVFRSWLAPSDVKIDFGVANGSFVSQFSDAKQPLFPGSGCSVFAPPTVQCTTDQVHVRLGWGNDRVDALRYVALGAVGVWGDGGNDDIRLNTLGGGAGFPVNGGSGRDTIQVNTSSPHLSGGTGADDLYAIGSGAADVTGDSGDDLIVNRNANATIHGNDGDDGMLLRGFGTASGDAGGDTMVLAGSGGFTANGGGGADTIAGGDGPDTVAAGTGNDLVDVSGGGTDTVDCGPGHDTVYADATDTVSHCEHVLAGPMPPNADVAAVNARAAALGWN